MKNSLRLTLVMAVLGFILGLGFLLPLPPAESRDPASTGAREAIVFVERDREPAPRRAEPASGSATNDPRVDVLFDVHTVSRSRYAKDVDAYVAANLAPDRDAIQGFVYCHNYDYDRQRANTALKRYSTAADAFPCYSLSLRNLASGYSLIETVLGDALILKSLPDFDPRRGGTVSVIFAYTLVKTSAIGWGKNDYRRLEIHVRLENGALKVTGPSEEPFDWFNLTMSEDLFNFPSGVSAFEFRSRGARSSAYPGKDFPKTEVKKKP